MIRVRFAPSPTGYLHIGGVRTALFNWILAKKEGGVFILRIEDTDPERSKPEFEEDIIRGLQTLGFQWDEFYRQSDRKAIYREYLQKLFDAGRAYPCFCSKEELELEQQAMISQGIPPKYNGHCRGLTRKETEERIGKGEKYVLRLRIPENEKISFRDLIRGQVEFDANLIGDFVVAKNFEEPLYNFTVVIDDFLMKITHVVRGEDHISNTPRQILVFRAIAEEPPLFAHLPLILNPDRSKMSKRYGDVSLRSYLKDGYLPEAILNFLALLGWHPSDSREIFSIDEIKDEFDLKKIQKGGAVFNIEKLNWLNRQYMARMPDEEFIARAQTFLPDDWQLSSAIAAAVRDRINKLSEIKEQVSFFFVLPDYPVELLYWKGQVEGVGDNLHLIADALMKMGEGDFSAAELEKNIVKIIPPGKTGNFLWPLRVALSGLRASPGPYEIMASLGKKEALERINTALEKL